MKPTQTGIATALALAVVGIFFILPSMWPFGGGGGAAAVSADDRVIQNPTAPMSDTTDQLQASDTKVGAGAVAETGDTVTVQYIGALTNGQVFDASANRGDEGFTFTLGAGQVIQGWDRGLVGMREGGTRRLVIPAALAYGDQAVGGVIPANSALLFEVQLVKVVKGGQ